ncbi:MAG: hypothetical protein AAGE84_03575 [Cyanobacteria bacterium P01_G01_bin.39]
MERETLEKLERKWIEKQLRYKLPRNRVDRASEGGFIWWDAVVDVKRSHCKTICNFEKPIFCYGE